jgi:aminoglycoside phosphotransferase (APT) family kinase protein
MNSSIRCRVNCAARGGKGAYFLSEGSADLVGATVAERLGHQSLEKWKLERVNTLRRSPTNASPTEILRTDLEKWSALLEAKLHPYELADLMVFHLMAKAGVGLQAFATYYQALGARSNAAGAFRATFGLEEGAFVEDFTSALARMATTPPTLTLKPWGRSEPEAFAALERDARALRAWKE